MLHKVHLPAPRRYSEDLDYVRRTSGPIGPILDALRAIGGQLGFDASTEVTMFPKVVFRGEFDGGGTMRVKVEINTFEKSPARPLIRVPHQVDSPWFTGAADVLTFEPEELVATKLRALHQRRKGRDLFDLWLALTEMKLDPSEIVEAFAPYRPDGYDQPAAEATFAEHVAHDGFRGDLATLADVPDGCNIDDAAELIRTQLFALL